MTVEPSYGLSNWPLPSPSATPKSTSYQHFNSPKAESPSAFADAFYTPSITGQCSPDLTPVSTHQPTFHPFISRNSPLSPDDPKFHCNVSSVSQLPLPPVDPSKRLSSSPNPQLSESESRTPDNPGSAKSDAMNPFQLQTPPHGDERGHLDPQQHHQHGHVSTPVRQTLQFQGNTFNTPTLQPPFPNTGLQISPDMYNYPSAPASAPPVPHGVFNWDQSPTIGSFDGRMMNSSHSSFASGPPLMGDLQNWHGQNLEQNSMLHRSYAQQSAQLSQAQQEPDMWLTSNAPGPQDLSSFSQSPSFPQPTTGVNPNLIFSFSSPPQTINPSHVKPNPPPSFDPLSRQPYEQQMRESTREREITKKARHEQQLHHNRSSSSLSTRPSLQRSNTDSGFRRNKNRAMDTRNSAVQALQAAENIPRKPSPLKRLSQVSLSSIPEGAFRLRPRTRLVIDDSGTARTETVTESDDDAPKRLSFGHWPDEDSSEEDAFISSQRNSLVFSSDLLRPTKHARIDSDDEDGGLYKRPLSSTSLSSLTSRMGATPLGRKISMDARRRLSQESQSSSLADRDREVASSSQDTILGRVSDDDDSGDAQNALKKLVGERMRREYCDPNATIKATLKPRRAATNPARSVNMIDITKFPSPPSPPHNSARPASSINTPTTDRSSRSAESTRCVCGTSDDGSNSPVVQCESCAKFLHVRCVFGRRAEERGTKLPRVYVCAYCTGQAREPISMAPGSFYEDGSTFGASPLGYKSGVFM